MKSCESTFATAYDCRASNPIPMRSIFMIITTRHIWMFCRGLLSVVLLVNFAFAAGTSSRCAAQNVESKTNQAMPAQSQINPRSELKVVAEGSQSSIITPFVAIIRDNETYEA